ncbi:hypothetical protein PSEUDO9AZ_10695 [Pseudomonas sp. 9AZ]|nr:hypothetical protein PSEUDO9AZ_10695 [Pseudomonas sp. 9AZ]
MRLRMGIGQPLFSIGLEAAAVFIQSAAGWRNLQRLSWLCSGGGLNQNPGVRPFMQGDHDDRTICLGEHGAALLPSGRCNRG